MTARHQGLSEQPYAPKKFLDVADGRMSYIDEGTGPTILFQHGSPTSSYLWRNVMPHVEGLGRLVAADLMGFGDSDKVDSEHGRERYSYPRQRERLFSLWDKLDLGDEVILVLHDIGSIYGFDWANQNRNRVQGIAYMESLVAPLQLADFPEPMRPNLLQAFSPEGRDGSLHHLGFVDDFLLNTRLFSEVERAHYRKPFLVPGEDRRPMSGTAFSIEAVPLDTTQIMGDYADWLSTSDVPKLFVNAQPGFILNGRLEEFARTWPNQTETSVAGTHFVQETSPHEVGKALAEFIRAIRHH